MRSSTCTGTALSSTLVYSLRTVASLSARPDTSFLLAEERYGNFQFFSHLKVHNESNDVVKKLLILEVFIYLFK